MLLRKFKEFLFVLSPCVDFEPIYPSNCRNFYVEKAMLPSTVGKLLMIKNIFSLFFVFFYFGTNPRFSTHVPTKLHEKFVIFVNSVTIQLKFWFKVLWTIFLSSEQLLANAQ